MRIFAMILAGFATVAAPSAHARDPAVAAPIAKFVTAFNQGDVATAQTTMAESLTITDEIAPFTWSGADAFGQWGASYEVDAKARGITDPGVTIGTPTRELVEGDHAYVIVPATYRFKQKGVKMAEVAQMTFSLARGAGGWKINGWTWTGPNASRAKK